VSSKRVQPLHAQRGQTFPIWAFGTLTVLVLFAFTLSYGNMLRYQIRAQNAADSAARGVLSIQATQWNEMSADLHAAAVEEYRIRAIIQGMLMSVRGDGGCDSSLGAGGPQACSVMYANLRRQYLSATARYTKDVLLMQRISQPTFDDQVAAVKAALRMYETNCGRDNGGDCAFGYTLVAAQPRVDKYLEDVYADCCSFVVGGATTANPALTRNFSPMEIEVLTCAKVRSLLPSFWNFSARTFTALGHAAATTTASTQEFMYVGTIVNPQTGKPFQVSEYPESATNTPVLGGPASDLWYRVDYGGNGATSDGVSAFRYQAKNNGLLAAMAWWSSIPTKPFSGPVNLGTASCK